ncbi:MAG: Coenzyme F420 hydrogenase/dehydrogenase, beta subunit C-terminal domain [Dehalococcoidia bacterium]
MTTIDLAADPSRDVRDRVAAASDIFELPDKIWFQKTAAAVIDTGRCVRCGSCIAACPSNSIGVGADSLPTLVRMCTGCSSCWDYCPMAGLSTDRLQELWPGPDARRAQDGQAPVDGIGPVRAAYMARARGRVTGQDGGVVTALLAELVRGDFVHGAIVSRRQDALHGRTVLATTVEQVEQGAGSVYDQTYALAALSRALPKGVDRIAMVGTPCQIAGLRALQRYPWRYRAAPVEKVTLAVALFCTRSFDPDRLTLELARRGIDVNAAAKVDIRDGVFRVYDGDGGTLFEARARDMRDATLRGCDECADFTGALADISVGNVGSRPGSTTVLIRTERGAEAWARAAAALDAEPLTDLTGVGGQAAGNRRRAARVAGDIWQDGRLWLSYSEYLAARGGSNRGPATPPPFRSHHYTVAC